MEQNPIEENNEYSSADTEASKGQPPRFIVVYVITFFIGVACVMAVLIHHIPEKDDSKNDYQRSIFVYTAAMMSCCGVLGGCLFDIRGLIKHSILEDYEQRYTLSYILRPIAGSLTGLIAFFLLLGGALTFTTQQITKEAPWSTLAGRMPYLAVGLLAGYSSQVFMIKLKDLADAIFAPMKSDLQKK